MGSDESPKQVANVAHLPGIVKYSLAMPDMHWGYGFPIGGVAAFEMSDGIVSPGGVGYDNQLRLPYDNHPALPGRLSATGYRI